MADSDEKDDKVGFFFLEHDAVAPDAQTEDRFPFTRKPPDIVHINSV